MMYSIIVAVYNRPDELGELLESLTHQTLRDFEVIVVEDGSQQTSESVCQAFASQLTIRYFFKENSGPGLSRNYGCRRASGDYFLFVDSDVTVPKDWLAHIHEAVHRQSLAAFGGPDREHESFSDIQKAISISMTSVLTTGGIRGSKIRVGGTFHPRSFNMGISRAVFNKTEGFSRLRFGEDVDFSIRIIEAGFRTGLIPDAWVYHKRRTDFRKFFKQVYNSGMARVNLSWRHPGTLKLTHFFPAAFTVYLVATLVALALAPLSDGMDYYFLLPFAMYLPLILFEGAIRGRSIVIGAMTVVAAMVQLVGYGTGFIVNLVRRTILGQPEGHAFGKTFYS